MSKWVWTHEAERDVKGVVAGNRARYDSALAKVGYIRRVQDSKGR